MIFSLFLKYFAKLGIDVISLNIFSLGKVLYKSRPIRLMLTNQHNVVNLLKNKIQLRHCDLNILVFPLIVHYYSKSISELLDELNSR